MPTLRWCWAYSRYRIQRFANSAHHPGRIAQGQHGFGAVPGAGGGGVVPAERKTHRDCQDRIEATHQRVDGAQQNAGDPQLQAGATETRRPPPGQHRSQLQNGRSCGRPHSRYTSFARTHQPPNASHQGCFAGCACASCACQTGGRRSGGGGFPAGSTNNSQAGCCARSG